MSPNWSKRAMRTKHGEDCSIWRSSKSPHSEICDDTVSGACKLMMKIGGINTEVYTAGSIRGATATTFLRLGVDVNKIMDRGDWLDAMVFQTYYNRSGRKVDWIGIIAERKKRNLSCGNSDCGGHYEEDMVTVVLLLLQRI